jgi:hypothetical protein
MTGCNANTVRAEPVEALRCLTASEEREGFDKLSPNGFSHLVLRKSEHV